MTTVNAFGKRSIMSLLLITCGLFQAFSVGTQAANIDGYDTTRMFQVMAKARRGEPITLGYLGGSITAGYAASAENKKWVSLVTDWWKTTFPNSTITMVNAGLGGTGSDIASYRVKDDLLSHMPDVIVCEFAVNDAGGEYYSRTMEGLVRQMLDAKGKPALLMLMLKQSNGTTSQASHIPVGNYYKVPIVSFANLIDAQVAKDNIALNSIFIDGLHPIDIGMKYIAQFITDELSKIYAALPPDSVLGAVSDGLPTPLFSGVYEHTYRYTSATIAAQQNNGWAITNAGWESKIPGSEMVFKLDGNSISLLYNRHNATERGQAEVWVDDGAHKTLDAYWNETWGPGLVLCNVAENLTDGPHQLHVKVLGTKAPESTGHAFYVLNVMKAGNIKDADPIGKTVGSRRIVRNDTALLNATESYDPDNDAISSYQWRIVSAPAGSTANIIKPSNSIASIIPDMPGTFQLGLTVSDGHNYSVETPVFIYVRASNQSPQAAVGNDTTVLYKKVLKLSGLMSYDIDNDAIIAYNWQLLSQPATSHVTLTTAQQGLAIFKPLVTGEYIVTLAVSDSFSTSIEDTLRIWVVSNMTNILQAQHASESFRIYPNPARKLLNVAFTGTSDKDGVIHIFSQTGMLVKENKLFANKDKAMQLNISSIKPGIYCVQINTAQLVFANTLVVE